MTNFVTMDEKFWLAIAFFSFLILGARYFLPSILKSLDSKINFISEEIIKAQKMKDKAEKLLNDAEKYYQDSVIFADKILQDAKVESEKFLQEMKQSTKKEIDKKTAATLDRIKTEQESAIREMKVKIIAAAVESLSSVDESDKKKQENLVNKSIQDFQKTIH